MAPAQAKHPLRTKKLCLWHDAGDTKSSSMQRSRKWRQLPKSLFQAAAAESRDLHVTILSLFADRDLTDPALTLEQVLLQLPAEAPDLGIDDDRVKRSLDQLVEWGQLEESRNELANYRTPEEFRARNLQWSLSGHGTALIAALDKAAEFLNAVTSLQPATIDALAQAIARAANLAKNVESDSVEVHLEWQQAESLLLSLVENVRHLQRRLTELMRDSSLSDEVLRQARDVIVDYVTQFIRDAEEPALRAKRALESLQSLGPTLLFERALQGANLAPDPILGDPGPAWIAERHRRLAALQEWFASGRNGGPARMDRLRWQGREWVLKFLKALDLRRSHHRLSAGIVEDFTQLARVFAACTHDVQSHRLAVAAFQLHGARHHDLHLGEEQGGTPDPGRLAGQNPAVPLSVQLRARSRKTNSKRERAVIDPRKAKQNKRREQLEELKAKEELRTAILTDGTVRLSSFGPLALSQYQELVDLLCLALTSYPDSNGRRRGHSSDGRLEVVIVDDKPAERTKLRTTLGALDSPDFLLSISLAKSEALL